MGKFGETVVGDVCMFVFVLRVFRTSEQACCQREVSLKVKKEKYSGVCNIPTAASTLDAAATQYRKALDATDHKNNPTLTC